MMPKGRRPAPPPPRTDSLLPAHNEVFELHMEGSEALNNPPLYEAICSKNPALVLHTLQHCIHDDQELTAPHGHGQYTYLHLLLMLISTEDEEEKCLPIIYQLSNAGADLNAIDATGATPLQLAIEKGLLQMMVALIRCGVDLCDRDYKAMVRETKNGALETEMLDILEKYSPGLWGAVGSGSTGIVNLLVNSWCRVNIYKRLPTGSMSLLLYAQRGRQPNELITILDDYEVTIEFVHATLAGDEIRMQDFLMDSKPCDPYMMDIAHQESADGPLVPRSLRDAAICMGHKHVLHLLPEGDHDTGEKSTYNKEVSEGKCSDYSSGSDYKSETIIVPKIETDTRFMTIGRAPRITTFHTTEPITAAVLPDKKHYVQGFYFHDKEAEGEEEEEEEVIFQGGAAFAASMGGGGGGGSMRYHDYSQNWDMPTQGKKDKRKDSKKAKKKYKDKDIDQTKSKMCVVM